MLCGKVPRNIIEQLQRSISRDLELVDVNPVQRHLVLPPNAGAATFINQTQDRRPPASAAGSSWAERRRQRTALRDLAEDTHLLDDLGLTREQALREAAKPFWR